MLATSLTLQVALLAAALSLSLQLKSLWRLWLAVEVVPEKVEEVPEDIAEFPIEPPPAPGPCPPCEPEADRLPLEFLCNVTDEEDCEVTGSPLLFLVIVAAASACCGCLYGRLSVKADGQTDYEFQAVHAYMAAAGSSSDRPVRRGRGLVARAALPVADH